MNESKSQITVVVDSLCSYEMPLLKNLIDMVFAPVSCGTKHKYVRVMPHPGTNAVRPYAFMHRQTVNIRSWDFYDSSNVYMLLIDPSIQIISKSSFNELMNLKAVYIPDTVTEIRDYAFKDCCRLSHIAIPNSVQKIGQNAFDNCFSLISITLPIDLKIVNVGTFSRCGRLQKVILPPTLEKIDDNAFYQCNNLKKIEIPDSVKEIRSNPWSPHSFSENFDEIIMSKKKLDQLKFALNYTMIDFSKVKIKCSPAEEDP